MFAVDMPNLAHSFPCLGEDLAAMIWHKLCKLRLPTCPYMEHRHTYMSNYAHVVIIARAHSDET